MIQLDSTEATIVMRPPARTWLFAGLMAISLAAAAGAGLVLGVLAGTRAGPGNVHWTLTVQSHGRIQLWVFAVILVTALVFEFLPRFNGRPSPSTRVRILVALLLGGGAVVSSISWALPGDSRWPGVSGGLITLAGAALFALQVRRIHPIQPLRVDLHPLFFEAGAAWLVASAGFAVLAAWRVVGDLAPLAESRAMHELLLRGFILNTILGVTIRALPGHAGTRPVPPREQAIAFVLVQGGLAFWLLGSGAVFESNLEWALRLGNILTPTAFVFYTISTGLLSPRRMSDRDPVHQMIRIAWAGGLAWAAMLAWSATATLPLTVHHEGAIRHVFMLGFMAPLIVAFAHIVLARFGTGLIPWRPLLTTGFVLVVFAWPLRATGGLLSDPGDAPARAMMGIAGVAAIAGLGLAAIVTGKTAWLIAHPRPRVFRRADVLIVPGSSQESRPT